MHFNSKTSIDRTHMQKLCFSTTEMIKPVDGGVGCGTELEIHGEVIL